MKKDAYIIFSKIPEAGYVKTRLEPDFSADGAAHIQSLMLDNLINLSTELSKSMAVFFVYQGRDQVTTDNFLNKLPEFINVFPQKDGNLGYKMSDAIETVQHLGYDKVVLTGSDIPQLSSELIKSAMDALDTNDIALGPTFDGGYYLFGTNGSDVSQFLDTDISWSTDTVLNTTKKIITDAHKKLFLTSTMIDVDFKADLEKVSAYIKE